MANYTLKHTGEEIDSLLDMATGIPDLKELVDKLDYSFTARIDDSEEKDKPILCTFNFSKREPEVNKTSVGYAEVWVKGRKTDYGVIFLSRMDESNASIFYTGARLYQSYIIFTPIVSIYTIYRVSLAIGAKSISTEHIADKAITSNKLANGAVTTDKIANGAVTTDKIAEGVLPIPCLIYINIADFSQVEVYGNFNPLVPCTHVAVLLSVDGIGDIGTLTMFDGGYFATFNQYTLLYTYSSEDSLVFQQKIDHLTANSGGGSSVMSLSGKLNLADKTEVQNAQKALANTNEIAYYLITDNEGKIPSDVPCYRVPEDVATALGCSSPHTITQSALSLLNISLNGFGVNVGDLIALTRVKVKVSDLASAIGKDLSVLGNTEIEIYQYKILSTNDAKPYGYNDIAEGVAGLMSPWDKEQVNGIRGIAEIAGKALPMPTFNVWDSNMNECFESGIYPWCLTGRPGGSADGTHYTCVVEKSTTADTSGYYTIVQTCYGREGVDEGKIFKRIIFRKDDGTTNWGVGWKRIDDGALDSFSESLGAFIEENLATKDEVDTAIANAITNTLNTPV